MTMSIVSTVTLGSTASSIEFSAIPQTGTDLYLVISGRSASGGNVVTMRFNGVTSGYTDRRLSRSGNTNPFASSNYVTDQVITGYVDSVGEASGLFGSSTIYIPGYSSSLTKVHITEATYENNSATNFMGLITGGTNITDAISTITLYVYGGTFAAGTTASLYMITKGSGGASVS